MIGDGPKGIRFRLTVGTEWCDNQPNHVKQLFNKCLTDGIYSLGLAAKGDIQSQGSLILKDGLLAP